MKQLDKIKNVLSEKGTAHIKEIADQLSGIPVPSIRKHLGQGEKKGVFTRIAKGIYALRTEDGIDKVYIHNSAAQEAVQQMVAEERKFDSVFLDPPYFSKALLGGNRGIKAYNFIQVDAFLEVMNNIKQLMRTEDSHIYLMLSGAMTAQKDMQKYIDAMSTAGLQLVEEGEYQKMFANGKPVTNVLGKVAAAERLLLFTISGKARIGELPLQMNFEVERPPVRASYTTQKNQEFVERIILQSTFEGENVLDAFAGSGVTGLVCYLNNRFVTLVEVLEDTVNNFIMPKFEFA